MLFYHVLNKVKLVVLYTWIRMSKNIRDSNNFERSIKA